MAYRYGDRNQMNLFPESIEEYVAPDDPVRAYDAFVETLNLSELGINIDEEKEGNPEYYPKAMLKLLLYGYSYGTRGARKLERACYHNISFIWLMGGLKPDHKTISEFRKKNKKALKNIIKQCAKMCIKLGLIEGNTLFVDGSKIRANASINNIFTKERAETLLKNIDKRIEQILNECDTIDEKEQNDSSLVKMQEELKDKKTLKAKIEDIVKELENEEKEYINSTDKDSVKIKGRQGTHAGYNGQIVVDEKHALIINSDVVNESNDLNQFAEQIEKANVVLSKQCENACGDAGYSDAEELKKIDDKGINVIVPSSKQAHGKEISPFDKAKFKYDSKNDCYICPQGYNLTYSFCDDNKNLKTYQIKDKHLCLKCSNYGICTKSKKGRSIKRHYYEDTRIKIENQYTSEKSQAIYKLRKEKVEHPFGHIKRNLGVSSFLIRGLDGAKAEMSLFASCFNILRMITIYCGVQGFISKLTM